MSTHIIGSWLETRRIIAQWIGVVGASILSGVLLGVLRRQGMSRTLALELALPVGFLLALLFWVWLSRRFSPKPIEINVPISAFVPTFDSQLPAVPVYSYQGPVNPAVGVEAPVAGD